MMNRKRDEITKERRRPTPEDEMALMEECDLCDKDGQVRPQFSHLRESHDQSVKTPRVAYFRRTAVKDYNGDVLRLCSDLQCRGNLAGPNNNNMAEVVALFHEIAANLHKLKKSELGFVRKYL